MASTDNPRLPLTSRTTPVVKYMETRDEKIAPSSCISMTPMPTSSNPKRLPNQSSITISEYELRRMPARKRHVVKKTLMANVGYRLGKRKNLHIQRRFIGDLMCFLGVFGIILMIIECELTFNRVDHKDSTFSLLLKATITFTTIILVGLVFYYHRIDLNLYCVDNSIDDWRIALTQKKIFLILLEAFVCMIHPIPGHFLVEWSSQHVKKIGDNLNFFNPYRSHQNTFTKLILLNSTITSTTMQPLLLTTNATDISTSYVPIDVILSLPMFFRLYLICRLIMLRSPLVRDASSQSLGYLNRVSFTFPFIIKAYIQQQPALCLTTFCISALFIASWAMRACDFNEKTGHMSMADATWLFTISFTTIGYGDIVPSTYCGRGIAAITGIIGVFSTALLVAVISQKLELTRSEKYVHNFVASIELAKAHKNQAANVVKFGWKVWHLKRKGKHMLIQYVQAQRKLLTSIHYLRKIKQQQRKLIDNCVTLLELYNVQHNTSTTTDETSHKVIAMENKINTIEDRLIEINHGMVTLQDKLNILLDRIQQR
ncbi:unnamed protein product [Rotaria magnacalcarata]|uniref:Calmodulin-binding domain-containing protein n=2 Tax=Rotaria magnacalcarata TaxID=392030 RepID=A0A816YE40_9BILA|nr:unnamed protein product [Rotaria magnacalcarata]CAF1598567.1 unnamed protein product [Rotaria magnacalcarata]CAF2145287.1 unnamed protein product [Rotaria magnacalcarata]CAF2157564.1 unnamed protein product [Rotaria magnacalcarata]CAF2166415.1 unnamed protein product [Rotaria magnacalcarata]